MINPTYPHYAAFPVAPEHEEGGLSKREYFAALAHQGLLARGCHGRLAAMEAVKAADLLVEALNQQEEGQP